MEENATHPIGHLAFGPRHKRVREEGSMPIAKRVPSPSTPLQTTESTAIGRTNPKRIIFKKEMDPSQAPESCHPDVCTSSQVAVSENCHPNICTGSDIPHSAWHDSAEVEEEEESHWYKYTDKFIEPERKRLPRQRQYCACLRKECTEMGAHRCEMLGRGTVLKRVSRHTCREHIAKHIKVAESTLKAVKFHIKLHHYHIEHRHHAHQRNDNQFVKDGCYITPTLTDGEIREEIMLAANIKKHNKEYYTNKIEPHLLGKGDGSLTLGKLRRISDSFNRSVCVKSEVNPCVKREVNLLDRGWLQSLSDEEIIGLAQHNGSAFISTLLESMNDNTNLRIPSDIPEDGYLEY